MIVLCIFASCVCLLSSVSFVLLLPCCFLRGSLSSCCFLRGRFLLSFFWQGNVAPCLREQVLRHFLIFLQVHVTADIPHLDEPLNLEDVAVVSSRVDFHATGFVHSHIKGDRKALSNLQQREVIDRHAGFVAYGAPVLALVVVTLGAWL